MRAFCTYLDARFLPRTLALYNSLRRCVPELKLYLLCFDDFAWRVLSAMRLPSVFLIKLTELEAACPQLLRVKDTRPLIQYFLTCTPFFNSYLLENAEGLKELVYIDSDAWFFSDPSPVFASLKSFSVGLTEHRFSPDATDRMAGRFNNGWMFFRNDRHAFDCLKWLGGKCLEHCDRNDAAGRFFEQKYLEEWPRLFKGVKTLADKGLNLAPWNLGNYSVTEAAGKLAVDGEPLIFYHFSGVKRFAPWLFATGLEDYGLRPSALVRERIYMAYIMELRACAERLSAAGAGSAIASSALNYYRPPFAGLIKRSLKAFLTRKYVYVARGRAFS